MTDNRPAMGTNKPVIVSACLLGIKCRYNAETSLNAKATAAIDALEDAGSYILPVCPEQIGGLPTPREPACIVNGSGLDVLQSDARVINLAGKDVTSFFIDGAEAVLDLALRTGAEIAVLKERSPSCGVSAICRGGRTCKGSGVTSALLKERGIKIIGF